MAEEGLKVLVRKRGGLKSAIVRINSAIINFDKSSNTKHFLTVRLESLKSLATKYDEVQSEIELILSLIHILSFLFCVTRVRYTGISTYLTSTKAYLLTDATSLKF